MSQLKLKNLLKTETPDIDYRLVKAKTMQRISDYEERQARQGFYLIPKWGMSLLIISMTISMYSLFQEVLSNLGVRGMGFGDLFSLPFLSFPFLVKATAALGDNGLLIVVNVFLILLFNRKFLGLYKVYRFLKQQAVFLKNMAIKIPALAMTFLRRT